MDCVLCGSQQNSNFKMVENIQNGIVVKRRTNNTKKRTAKEQFAWQACSHGDSAQQVKVADAI